MTIKKTVDTTNVKSAKNTKRFLTEAQKIISRIDLLLNKKSFSGYNVETEYCIYGVGDKRLASIAYYKSYSVESGFYDAEPYFIRLPFELENKLGVETSDLCGSLNEQNIYNLVENAYKQQSNDKKKKASFSMTGAKDLIKSNKADPAKCMESLFKAMIENNCKIILVNTGYYYFKSNGKLGATVDYEISPSGNIWRFSSVSEKTPYLPITEQSQKMLEKLKSFALQKQNQNVK